ncbi:MAG: porin, partial [Pseudolabrys sp.]
VNVNTVPPTAAGSIVSLVGLQNGGTDISTEAGNVGIPDIVGNLRVDQAWGSAQIMGALHDVRAGFYPGSTAVAFGNPSDAWGWAVGGGVQVNLPMLGKGDVASIAANYCQGASRYCSNPNGGVRGAGNLYALTSGHTVGFGNLDDAYFSTTGAGTGTGLQLPTAWNIAGGVAHKWNGQWQTSLYAGYLSYKANSTSVDAFCAATAGVSATGCRDFTAWQVGSRTLWNPVANLDVSVDLLYHKINGAMQGFVAATYVGQGPQPTVYGSVGVLSGIFRVQRNFWP